MGFAQSTAEIKLRQEKEQESTKEVFYKLQAKAWCGICT